MTTSQAQSTCLICGIGLTSAARYPGLLRCPGCTFLTADVALDDEQLLALYGEDYFHGSEYADYVSEEDELRLNFRRRLDPLLRLAGPNGLGRLHEVGCAYGFFLEEARGHFSKVSGIDIAPEATAHARDVLRLDVATGDYRSQQLEEPIDVVCMWDTVEHLPHPDRFLFKASGDLRPGGLLALTTGDVDSLNARLRGPRWRMVHPPTHLHYFSVSTLRTLLDRAGMDLVHVEHPGNARTLRSILYGVLALRAGRRELYTRLESRLPGLDRSVTLNLRDIVYIIARKR